MIEYKVREPMDIPYFDHGKNLRETISSSSSRRNTTKLGFVYRKMRNILLYRFAYLCPLNGRRVASHRKRGITIGENVFIGQHTVLDNAYPEYIYIEDNVSLAGNNVILAHSNPYPHFAPVVESGVSPVIIKEGAWIGVGAIILRGVTIGRKAIISAGTVVDKDVPDCCLAKGNPMKIVSDFSSLID